MLKRTQVEVEDSSEAGGTVTLLGEATPQPSASETPRPSLLFWLRLLLGLGVLGFILVQVDFG
ncbi:MAG TPA: hypothetical protein VFZ87_05190, partial [Gemmatimonadales bacterium]